MFATVFCALMSCLGPPISAMGTIILKGNKSYEGTFEAYKNDRFCFQPKEGKKLHEQRMSVESLILQPPTQVSVKPYGEKERDDLKLKGYEPPNFIFEKNGEIITMPGSRVTRIEMGLDFNRTMQDVGVSNVPANKADVEVEKLVEKGIVTIIHFHVQTEKMSPNVRQENYVGTLAKNGKVAVVRIDISDWDEPVAKKYNITSSPQFWFYNRSGKLVKKLVDRFTGNDIDMALKAASR